MNTSPRRVLFVVVAAAFALRVIGLQYGLPSVYNPDEVAITARALEDRSSISAQALSIFIRCYGSFAGDMALAFFARGGVYVCGGIAAKLAGRFAEGDFMEAFNYKGRHRDIAASIPVRLVTNESLGLAGAALAAVAAD